MSGQLQSIPGAFKALDGYVQDTSKSTKRSFGEIMNDLTNPELMDKLAPGWDKPNVVKLTPGKNAKFTEGTFIKKYPNSYLIKEVKTKYAFLEVPKKSGGTETIGFPIYTLGNA